MGIPVTFNGLSVVVPEVNDQGWGSDVSALLIELANFAATSTTLVQSSRIATVSPVTILSTEFAIGVNIPTPSVVNLPPGSGNVGKCYLVYDYSGSASINPITINAAGLDTINGSSSYVINQNRGSILLQFSGSQWNIIASAFIPSPGAVAYSQDPFNRSFVSSPTTSSVSIPNAANLSAAAVTFSGSQHYQFSVTLSDGRSMFCVASESPDTITVLSDRSNIFNPELLAGPNFGIAIIKAGNFVTFRNRTGSTQNIEVKSFTTALTGPTSWA
jgi:hypothetical protein